MDQQKPAFKRTRIAPTPSGFLHVGNVLSFAITAGLAEASGAKILLRIDDMDRERATPEYVDDIFDTLNFLGLPWHEGPRDNVEFWKEYSQLHRLQLYNQALSQLVQQQQVFACNCSRSQILLKNSEGHYPGTCRDKNIPLDSKEVCWRIRTEQPAITIMDLPGKKNTAVLPGSMNDFVVRKKDGFPAYQLTSLIDDLFFEVDLIVRGEDLRPSTLAQHYLATVLGKQDFYNTRFHHHALLYDAEGQKLSKSAGAVSIRSLRQEGKTPADIYALIGRMMNLPAPVRDWPSLAAALELA
ncbi:MAG: tRNA glutamyl-Q synthetase [Chitinophagaceae bacterium]|nr:MAG: tRNA glutamyl-Q synthetase [Chitinophagaceae bacterium]